MSPLLPKFSLNKGLADKSQLLVKDQQSPVIIWPYRNEIILESNNWSSASPVKGFYIRLKAKDDSFGVALQETDANEESDGEPILSVKDSNEPALRVPVFYGFSIMSGSNPDDSRGASVLVHYFPKQDTSKIYRKGQ